MSSPSRLLMILGLGACGGALLAAWQPGGRADRGPDHAPLLGAIHAAPIELADTYVLESGQTLGGILTDTRIAGAELARLLLAVQQHKDPRRLMPGSEVTIRRWASTGDARAVELRVDADSTIRLERTAVGWTSDVLLTPVAVDTVYAAGMIEAGRTLYEALVYDERLDLPPAERVQLVAELAEIYMYTLDFTHEIRPGDRYRLVYEREARPDGTARSRRILAAEVENEGRLHPAIYFEASDDTHGYYDPEGNALRKAFRRYPLDYVRITSAFSWRRYHPILGIYRAHLGTDFGASRGTPVRAAGDGRVAFAGDDGGYGNVVKLRHPGGYETRYAHLSRFADGIRSGARVEQGEIIAYVGASGLATAPHLHYELRRDGQALNPRRVELPGAPPIPQELRDRFGAVVARRVALLDRIMLPGPRLASTATGSTPVAHGSR